MTLTGHPTGVACPNGCDGTVVYNGDYFCENGDWHAPEGWIYEHPVAYYNLMNYRAKRWGVPVASTTNFNPSLYEKGRPHE